MLIFFPLAPASRRYLDVFHHLPLWQLSNSTWNVACALNLVLQHALQEFPQHFIDELRGHHCVPSVRELSGAPSKQIAEEKGRHLRPIDSVQQFDAFGHRSPLILLPAHSDKPGCAVNPGSRLL